MDLQASDGKGKTNETPDVAAGGGSRKRDTDREGSEEGGAGSTKDKLTNERADGARAT